MQTDWKKKQTHEFEFNIHDSSEKNKISPFPNSIDLKSGWYEMTFRTNITNNNIPGDTPDIKNEEFQTILFNVGRNAVRYILDHLDKGWFHSGQDADCKFIKGKFQFIPKMLELHATESLNYWNSYGIDTDTTIAIPEEFFQMAVPPLRNYLIGAEKIPDDLPANVVFPFLINPNKDIFVEQEKNIGKLLVRVRVDSRFISQFSNTYSFLDFAKQNNENNLAQEAYKNILTGRIPYAMVMKLGGDRSIKKDIELVIEKIFPHYMDRIEEAKNEGWEFANLDLKKVGEELQKFPEAIANYLNNLSELALASDITGVSKDFSLFTGMDEDIDDKEDLMEIGFNKDLTIKYIALKKSDQENAVVSQIGVNALSRTPPFNNAQAVNLFMRLYNMTTN